MMAATSKNGAQALPVNFATVSLDTLATGRKGKHHIIIAKILNDLEVLPPGSALKIPRTVLNGTKLVNIRSALNRATRGHELHVSTSTDDENFYVWKTR
ncbi:MAG TPA: hypothetical protein VJT08_12160 [Terriglobales bacterium]|nr:hypothetical protein [Terriglobales bacterium]